MYKKVSPTSIWVTVFFWLCIVASFLIYKTADASILYDGTGGDASCNLTGHSQTLAGKFTMSSGSYINNFRFSIKNFNPDDDFIIRVYGDSAGVPALPILATSTVTNIPTSDFTNRTFTLPTDLYLATGDYWVALYASSTPNFQVNINKVTPSLGQFRGFSSGSIPPSGSPANDCGGGENGVSFNGLIEYTAPTDNISISYPVGSSTISEFTNWTVDLEQATTTTATSTDYYVKRIYVGASTSTMTIYSGGSNENPTGGVLDIYKPNPLGLGTWYAFAQSIYVPEVFDSNSPIVATSSIISFTINAGLGASGYWGTSTSTASSSDWTLTCDMSSGFFSNSLCNLANFLFIPNSESVSNFTSLGDLIKNKPPVGYFYEIQDAFNGFNSTATSSLAFSDFSNLDSGFLFPLRSLLAILLWVTSGFYIYNRINHLIL